MSKKNKKVQPDQSIEDLKASLKEYNHIVSKLKAVNNLKELPLQFARDSFSKMGREEKRICLWDKVNDACNANVYEDVDKLLKLTHQSYNQFKALPSTQYSTHRYITSQASELLNLDPAKAKMLLDHCTYPDEPTSDMCDLIFEGHFYGKTNCGEQGNFLTNLPSPVLAILEFFKKLRHGEDEDIHEHAVMNFARYYNQSLTAASLTQKYFYVGVAAHFLQDLTAPHHAGNYPAMPYVGHYFFEKFASQYVYDHPNFTISLPEYNAFTAKINSSLGTPELFAQEITKEATQYIEFIKPASPDNFTGEDNDELSMDVEIEKFNSYLISRENKDWEEAIKGAVPLAVYATTYLFKTALK